MAPDLLAEWPATSVSNKLLHEATMSDFEGFSPLSLGNKNSSGGIAARPRRFNMVCTKYQAHPFQQGLSPQHCNLLAIPNSCWSIFEWGMNSLTVFLRWFQDMWPQRTFDSSISLNI
jgi:hypothetical protein